MVFTLTPTENGIYNWFRLHGVRVYTVFINHEFTFFRVINGSGEQKELMAIQYADWLLSWRKRSKKSIKTETQLELMKEN